MSLLARNRLIGLGLALALFIADQWSKHYVVEVLGLRQVGQQVELLPFFDLTRTNNYGVSLGMFQATSIEMRWLLVLLTAIIAAVVLVWMLRERRLWDIAPLAMILGGALGNIRDRYSFGYVVDFADFHLFGWHFYIFNVADAAITVGVAIILARALFMRETPAAKQDAKAANETPET